MNALEIFRPITTHIFYDHIQGMLQNLSQYLGNIKKKTRGMTKRNK